MESKLAPHLVLPNPRIPRTIGFMNLVLGQVLLLTGLGCMAFALLAPSISRETLREEQAGIDARVKARADSVLWLKTKEAAAGSDADRERYRKEREQLESEPPPPPPDLGPWFFWEMLDPWLALYFWVECGVAVVLNLLMIVSGAGLIRLRPRARRLALWVFGGKLARIAAMSAVALLVVIPHYTAKSRDDFLKNKATGGAEVTADARRDAEAAALVYATVKTLAALGLLVFGSAYPAVAMALLARRSAWAACQVDATRHGLDLPKPTATPEALPT